MGFYDGEEDNRPKEDYCAKYPNRDVPAEDFPDGAWQSDAVYVNHIIDAGEQLVERTMEAILTEYGWGKGSLEKEDKAEYVKLITERTKMYKWSMLDLNNPDTGEPREYRKGRSSGGGWTTIRSMDGLIRRLLHAMMTNDTFTVVLAGHSAAAGHGNHFRQSYLMQFHKVMKPVFARLGVKLICRNLSQGGLGTIQNSMGFKDLYGDEIDVVIWDSGMTEGDSAHVEYFMRQALISGNRVPVVWGGHFSPLKMLHNNADADVGVAGQGQVGIIETKSAAQADSVPFASRYMKCGSEAREICDAEPRFCATCWIHRDDVSKDLFKQMASKPGSQVRWHPGWRVHQMAGRVMALSMLSALQQALNIWSEGTLGGPPLDEEVWHVSEYYDNIRGKALELDPMIGSCGKMFDQGLPLRLCNTALQSRSLYTPRNNPHETSLLNLVKGKRPEPAFKTLYDGPDPHNECYDLPKDEVDVLAVAAGGKDRKRRLEQSHMEDRQDNRPTDQSSSRLLGKDDIEPGTGWQHVDEFPGDCDGTYESICARHETSTCPLIGHHDSRGHLVGNEYSGWLVLVIPKVSKGLILLKLATAVREDINTITPSTDADDKRRLERAESENFVDASYNDQDYFDGMNSSYVSHHRRLGMSTYDDNFVFEFAINGKKTKWNKSEFPDHVKKIQRMVEVITVLDDENFGEQENVEVALRMLNCGRTCTIGITHAYWA